MACISSCKPCVDIKMYGMYMDFRGGLSVDCGCTIPWPDKLKLHDKLYKRYKKTKDKFLYLIF